MVEKRKRFSASLSKNKRGPAQSVSRIKLDNELRWNWIGSEVQRTNEITLAHRIRAAGLEQRDGRRACSNSYSERPANGLPVTGSSDAKEGLITIDSDDESDDETIVGDDEIYYITPEEYFDPPPVAIVAPVDPPEEGGVHVDIVEVSHNVLYGFCHVIY